MTTHDPSAATSDQDSPSNSAHPLDPLGSDEFRQTAAILRRDAGVTDRWRFAAIELVEPSKAVVRGFSAGDPITRHSRVVCFDRDSGDVYIGVVSLSQDSVVSFDHQPGVQPNMTLDEWHDCDATLRKDPRVIEALAKRGITDISKVFIDTWTFGDFLIPEKYKDRRVCWTDVWLRLQEDSNPYANPVNGFHCLIDVNAMELLEIEDSFEITDKPNSMGEYTPHLIPGLQQRTDIKPLEIVQPEGVSFTLNGNELTWQNWTLRVGFNYREGLVLHGISYNDQGRKRPVADRMSFAEMVVPYRDPAIDHVRRTAFDIGEWGLGFMTTSLDLGCDCLGEIRYLDAVLHNSAGEPYTITNAICIHEEDDRVLWKHVDPVAGAEVRRSRRLTVSCHVTVANYEYLVYWSFYQDGTIQCEVRATGIMVVSHLDEGQSAPHGTMVDQRTYAPFHQHFLVARLDMNVDGGGNTVYMTESRGAEVSEADPYGIGLISESTPLKSEAEGRQDYCWETQRAWKVVNESSLNAMGTPVSYKLVPTGTFPSMLDPGSPVMKRSQVIGHTLWVTPYSPDERWPCGEFVNQSVEDEGLPVWTKANRSIENTDVVLWYVFGIHHITRPEDWPIMPSDTVSFMLKPFGFFDRNPALDLPPSGGHCHQ